jgi:hypothetical protein
MQPLPIALALVLMLACGFIAGVLVEKGQGASGGEGAAGGLASRLAGLRSGAGRGSGGTARSAFTGLGGGGNSATVGEVTFVKGDTLYVTDAEGNTLKVLSSDATVTKTVSASARSVHPGETVLVSGSRTSGGAIRAQTIRSSPAGATGAGGGTSALFGGGAGASSSSSGPSLFGPGG